MHFFSFRCITLAALAIIPAFADQVVLKNGDRISGAIVKSDKKLLTMKSEFAGTVEIQWDAITELKADAPVYVGLEDGQTVAGTVVTTDGRLIVQTKDTGTISAAKDKVQFVRNKDEQQAQETQIERFRRPRLVDLWTGFVALGIAQATGNAITSTVTSSASATRSTSRDRIAVNFNSIYSKNNTAGQSVLAANSMRGGIGYNLNLKPKLFVFGSTDLEFDEFQRLDLRFVPSAGFGYHARKSTQTVFDIFGGGSLNKEFFSTGLRRSSGELMFGDEITHKLFGNVTTLYQKLVVYPNLSRTGEYRINFDFSQATTLRKWLAWQVSFSNRYLSNPVPGRKTNDLVITTGFRLTFAQ